MRYGYNAGQPTYAPNSFGGPAADPQRYPDTTWETDAGEIGRYAYTKHSEDDDFGQAGTMVREVLDDAARDRLANNIIGHAGDPDVQDDMKPRIVEYWTNVDADLGQKVAEGIGAKVGAAK